ncbi:kinase-like domain-containing protein [Tuber brumale]|nr:kinase-like domain-containing protein [Tuber brumale]
MSNNTPPPFHGSYFSNNVNSGNINIGGDVPSDFWGSGFGSLSSDMMKRRANYEGSPRAGQSQGTGQHVRAHPGAPSSTQGSGLGVNSVITGNSPFFTGGAMFREPRDKTPEPAPGEQEFYGDPVREPPAWKLKCKIGSGAFGTVFLEKVQARGMESPELWAVKRISKAVPNFPAKQYQAEVRNLQVLSKHDWFVKFNTSYEDDHYVYIAMEYMPIGDMTKTFAKGYRWNESDTKVVMEQLLRGLVEMHKEGITHRDLKPENIFLCLLDHRGLRVKIGDFGTSKRIPPTNSATYLKTTAGTEGYMAPEMEDTDKNKTNRVDIWSLGCILYRMVAGNPLFEGRRDIWRYAMKACSPPPAVQNLGLSVPCLDFLRDVLQPDPAKRPSAEACLKLPWITSKGPGSGDTIGRDLHNRLCKIQVSAHDVDSFSDAAANWSPGNTLTRSFSTVATPVTDSTGGVLRSTRTFNTTRTLER